MSLKADHVIYRAVGIVPPQLDDRVIFMSCARVDKSDRLQRPVAQSVHPAARHDLDRHAALKDPAVVKAVHLGLLSADKLGHEGEILLLRHRAVYIIRCALIIARCEECVIHIDALERDYRGDSVVKVQVAVRAELFYLCRYRVAAEGACCDDDLALGYFIRLGGDELNVLMLLERAGYILRKALAVNGKRAARGHAVCVRGLHDERAHLPHLRLEKPDGVAQLVAPQGV